MKVTNPSEEKIGGIIRWEVESDLRALKNVGKIRSDKKRMKAVGLLAKQEAKALASVVSGKSFGDCQDDD